MDTEMDEDTTIYKVVVNHEGQYSIWPVDRDCPPGWSDAGKRGTKAECLSYIEEVWTDMRPLSLRREMERLAAQPTGLNAESAQSQPEDARDDLVSYLSKGDHPVEATSRSADEFLKRIASGYINIRFTATRGGTELGVKLDAGATSVEPADGHEGKAHIVGDLTLNYRRVRFVADLEVGTLRGVGRLQLV